jgi:uncharacterized protein YjbJ (UPF0337 family)
VGDKSDKVTGKVQEGAGKVTGDHSQAEKGRRKQMKSDVKKSGKKLKDAAKKL